MMRPALLLAMLAVASASIIAPAQPQSLALEQLNFGAQLDAALQEAHLSIQSLTTELSASRGRPETQSLLTCYAAITSLATQLTTCASQFTSMFTGSSFSQASMTTFCTGSCVTDTRTKINNALSECLGQQDLSSNSNLNTALQAVKMICVQDGTSYCWQIVPTLKSLTLGTATQTDLAGVCTGCVAKLAQAASNFGLNDVAKSLQKLAPLCIKVGNNFCALKFATAQAQFALVQSPDNAQSALAAVCDPCVSAFLVKQHANLKLAGDTNAAALLAPLVRQLRAICDKKDDGTFCLPQAIQAVTGIQGCPALTNILIGTATTCAPECAASLQNLSDSLGCCLGTVARMLTVQQNTDSELTALDQFKTVKTFVTETCGVSAVLKCASKLVDTRLVIKNLLWSYVSQNLDAVKTALAADIAAAAGVPASSVEIVSLLQGIVVQAGGYELMAATDVTVTAKVTPPTTAEATKIETQLKGYLAASSLSLSNTASLGTAARADATVVIAADPTNSAVATAVNPEGPNPNSACGVSASAMFASALAAAALVM